MSDNVAGAGGLPGEGVIPPQAAAYAFFVLAGWAVVSAAWMLLDNVAGYVRVFSDPSQVDFWLALLPGPAAALGAAAVHRPFMRAVHARRHGRAHGWAAAGALAAHAAYAALVFAGVAAWGATVRKASLMAPGVLDEALDYTLVAGMLSLIFGFLPNVLVAEVFAGFMLGRQAARSRKAIEPLLLSKGADHASSVLVE